VCITLEIKNACKTSYQKHRMSVARKDLNLNYSAGELYKIQRSIRMSTFIVCNVIVTVLGKQLNPVSHHVTYSQLDLQVQVLPAGVDRERPQGLGEHFLHL